MPENVRSIWSLVRGHAVGAPAAAAQLRCGGTGYLLGVGGELSGAGVTCSGLDAVQQNFMSFFLVQ